jgi:hypothetical protein
MTTGTRSRVTFCEMCRRDQATFRAALRQLVSDERDRASTTCAASLPPRRCRCNTPRTSIPPGALHPYKAYAPRSQTRLKLPRPTLLPPYTSVDNFCLPTAPKAVHVHDRSPAQGTRWVRRPLDPLSAPEAERNVHAGLEAATDARIIAHTALSAARISCEIHRGGTR